MSNRRSNIALLISTAIGLVCLFSQCSTQKNTAATRGFHQMCVLYNINFNGSNAYKEGIKLINEGTNDDFTRPIPLFVASNHQLSAGTSQMERTIEKCRKAIKKHSITVKPKRDEKRWKNEKYQYFYNQEEYVKGVKEAWILLGKAEYHKGDFLGAAATFEYIQKHYPSDKLIVAQARIWQARAYAEQGWIYEAEQSISRIKEKDVHYSLLGDYAATRADLYLRASDYSAAIPYLKTAVAKQKDKYLTPRYNFVLGRAYFEQGDYKNAEPYFRTAMKKAQSTTMEFNARLYLLQCQKNWKESVKKLEKMGKLKKNEPYLDQIYGVIGDIYLSHKDTVKAIKAYEYAVEKTTREGVEKANVWITLGDLYYQKADYLSAEPCFSGAVNLINSEHDDYNRVSKLSETLSSLATYHNTIVLQDSLQSLAQLTEPQLNAVLDTIIARLIAQEKADSIAAAKAERGLADVQAERINMSTNQSTEWYFYNPQLMRSGADLFKRKWGSRVLEDDWRRKNKVKQLSFGFGDDNNDEYDEDEEQPTDSLSTDIAAVSPASDPHKREYYLEQIPFTEQARQASDTLIAEAMYNMASLFENQLNDTAAAVEAYKRYINRFPEHKDCVEALFSSYRIACANEDSTTIEHYKNIIINDYPTSHYAQLLSQPDYLERTREMYASQDSLYQVAYQAYTSSNYEEVARLYFYMLDTYPQSNLLPKFQFLYALSIGKSQSKEEFYEQLNDLTTHYPSADVTPMAKDIMALISQGLQTQTGQSHGSLLNKQAPTQAPDTVTTTKVECDDCQYALVLEPRDQNTVNALLFDIAAFNFTHFMVKDYDIGIWVIENKRAVVIQTENKAEAEWYEKVLLAEPTLEGKITLDKVNRYMTPFDNIK